MEEGGRKEEVAGWAVRRWKLLVVMAATRLQLHQPPLHSKDNCTDTVEQGRRNERRCRAKDGNDGRG